MLKEPEDRTEFSRKHLLEYDRHLHILVDMLSVPGPLDRVRAEDMVNAYTWYWGALRAHGTPEAKAYVHAGQETWEAVHSLHYGRGPHRPLADLIAECRERRAEAFSVLLPDRDAGEPDFDTVFDRIQQNAGALSSAP